MSQFFRERWRWGVRIMGCVRFVYECSNHKRHTHSHHWIYTLAPLDIHTRTIGYTHSHHWIYTLASLNIHTCIIGYTHSHHSKNKKNEFEKSGASVQFLIIMSNYVNATSPGGEQLTHFCQISQFLGFSSKNRSIYKSIF